jgi:hypothetical protein
MHISEVSFGRTVKCFNPLNQEEWIKCNVKVSLNETDNVTNGEQLATQFVDEKINSEMLKRGLVYVSDEELPTNQVQEYIETHPFISSESDLLQEMQSYKLGSKAFIAVYGEMVKGNPKLEEAYKNKLNELSNN